MSDAMRWLEGAAGQADDALDAPLSALNRAMIELGEAQSGLAQVLDALAFDPSALEDTEERLFAIRAAARKHNVLADDLADLAIDLTARLAALDAGDAQLKTLQAEVQASEDAYAAACVAVTQQRTKAAKALDKAVMAELAPLKMDRAVFTTRVDPGSEGPDGCDTVAFEVATNPGAPAGPLAKIASGGELSRFLLALKVCLSRADTGLTLIFDEIDRGVGGATADAVGRRLQALAADGQILVVTHSPQVAALGRHHWRVQKDVRDGATLSTVVSLDPHHRVDEVERMLSGDSVTEAARDAARALLSG